MTKLKGLDYLGISNFHFSRDGNTKIIMCQFRSVNCNKCPTLGRAVDNAGNHECLGREDIWEISMLHLSAQSCGEAKNVLQIKSLLKMEQTKQPYTKNQRSKI